MTNPYAHDRGSGRRERVRAIDIAGRVPPHNEHAEQAVLSAVLLDGRVLDELRTILPNGQPFYGDAHGRIYDAAIAVRERGQPVDIETVAAELKDRERLEAVGGISYLVKIVDATPAVAHVAAHATIVREKWRVRRAIEHHQMAAAEGYGDYGSAQEYLDRGVEALANIADEHIDRRDPVQLYDVMKSTIVAYGTSSMRGTPTGLTDVDKRTTGMHDGELIIVAARPGMGKTSYVLNIAANVAAPVPPDSDVPRLGVMVFSLEMPKEQLGQRMGCSEARVPFEAFRKQELNPDQWDRLVEAADRLSQLPVWIDDTPAITLHELRAKVRRRQHEFDKAAPPKEGETGVLWKQRIGLVVVDYIQLMRGSGSTDNREQEISEISRGLKALAKELRVPVIALSQLNREVEKRSTKDKRPQLSDLRESGAIEQDADVVQFIYRPEYYKRNAGEDVPREMVGYAEVIVAKQRNGPTGRVPVTFLDYCMRFENRSRDAWSDGDGDE